MIVGPTVAIIVELILITFVKVVQQFITVLENANVQIGQSIASSVVQ